MAAQAGKIVIVSALGGTYQREGFNDILDLIPKAEKIKQLHAICRLCYHQASFTLRTVTDSSLELIGGKDEYMPVCRECYLYQTSKQEELAAAVAKSEAHEVTFAAAEDGEEPAKLIVSVQKSQTSTNAGDSGSKESAMTADDCADIQKSAAMDTEEVIPFNNEDAPDAMLKQD